MGKSERLNTLILKQASLRKPFQICIKTYAHPCLPAGRERVPQLWLYLDFRKSLARGLHERMAYVLREIGGGLTVAELRVNVFKLSLLPI